MNSLGSITIPAKMESLMPSLTFVKTCTERAGFHTKRVGEIELCLEEILVNIINYAYPNGPGEMDISCGLADNGALTINVSDQGVPFDILSVDQPDISASVDERHIGGLGIFFVKQLMDDVHYRRENNKNILTLTIKNSSTGDS